MVWSLPFLPTRIWRSFLNADMRAFSICMVSPAVTRSIWSFQRQSLIFPVPSETSALATLAWFPNLVTTAFGFETSTTLALRFTFFMPTRRSLIWRGCDSSFFLVEYLSSR